MRSDLRARALGTLAQSETLAGRYESARQASDRAERQFAGLEDRQRQCHYRCHLEALAGDFVAARGFLALAVDRGDRWQSDMSHAGLAAFFRDLDPDRRLAEAFHAFHWLRLGAIACRSLGSERDAFLAAFADSRVADWRWGQEGLTHYPAHGVLRRVALLRALLGDRDGAVAALNVLRRTLDPVGRGQVVLGAVQLAACAETAAALWADHRPAARQILDEGHAERPGLRQLLRSFARQTESAFPRVWRAFAGGEAAVAPALDRDDPSGLAGLGRAVEY
jgi:hypothetical protein